MRKRDEGSKQRLRRHLLGWAQNLVIVLLLVSTVALVAESGMLDLSAVKGAGSEQNSVDRHAAYTAGAELSGQARGLYRRGKAHVRRAHAGERHAQRDNVRG